MKNLVALFPLALLCGCSSEESSALPSTNDVEKVVAIVRQHTTNKIYGVTRGSRDIAVVHIEGEGAVPYTLRRHGTEWEVVSP